MLCYTKEMNWGSAAKGFQKVCGTVRDKCDLAFVKSQWAELLLVSPRIVLLSTHF